MNKLPSLQEIDIMVNEIIVKLGNGFSRNALRIKFDLNDEQLEYYMLCLQAGGYLSYQTQGELIVLDQQNSKRVQNLANFNPCKRSPNKGNHGAIQSHSFCKERYSNLTATSKRNYRYQSVAKKEGNGISFLQIFA